MKKRVISLFVVIALMGTFLVACGQKPEEGDTGAKKDGEATVLEVAFNQDETHPQYIALKEFGETLKEKTNGEYSIEIYPSELLGAQKETLEMVQSGTIAMSMVANSLLENWNPDLVVFNLPYIFVNPEHQRAVINDKEYVGDLYDSLVDEGIKILASFHGGVRNVYTSKAPVKTVEDLKGLKIRVMQSDTNLQMMNLMGGTGVSMGQGEVYTAIQTGVLDGAENNELIFNDLIQYEVAPYYSYTQHLMQPDALTISTKVWDSLPDDVKTIFEEELPKAVDREFEEFDKAVKVALDEAEEKGAKIEKDVDREAFRQAVAPLSESKINNEVTKKLYEHILDIADDYK